MIYLNVVCIAVSSYIAGEMRDPLWKALNGFAALINIVVVVSHLA